MNILNPGQEGYLIGPEDDPDAKAQFFLGLHYVGEPRIRLVVAVVDEERVCKPEWTICSEHQRMLPAVSPAGGCSFGGCDGEPTPNVIITPSLLGYHVQVLTFGVLVTNLMEDAAAAEHAIEFHLHAGPTSKKPVLYRMPMKPVIYDDGHVLPAGSEAQLRCYGLLGGQIYRHPDQRLHWSVNAMAIGLAPEAGNSVLEAGSPDENTFFCWAAARHAG